MWNAELDNLQQGTQVARGGTAVALHIPSFVVSSFALLKDKINYPT